MTFVDCSFEFPAKTFSCWITVLFTLDEKPTEVTFEEEIEGLTSVQKVALGFIWVVSGVYSLMSEQILSKERDILCSLRSDLSDKFNFMSLFIAIGVPFVFGPVLCPIGHSILSIIACCKGVNPETCEPRDAKSQGLSDCGVITGTKLQCFECNLCTVVDTLSVLWTTNTLARLFQQIHSHNCTVHFYCWWTHTPYCYECAIVQSWMHSLHC